jgi:CHAT domain-containing protein
MNDPLEEFSTPPADIPDEIALETALTNWLPIAYSHTSGGQSDDKTAEIKRNLEELSELLLVRHHDSWLREFLQFKDHAEFPSAVTLLAQAIKENQNGNPDEALRISGRARLAFYRMHNLAGQGRALFEEIYALQRSAHSQGCLALIGRAAGNGIVSQFVWLKGQLLIEKSTCIGRKRDLHQAFSLAEQAVVVAQNAGYSILELRALGALTDLKTAVNDDDEAWRLASEGLQQFWQGGFPPIRGYQFYGSLGYTAEDAKQWRLATALNLQTVILAAATENKSVEAMLRYRLAGDALMAGDSALAATQFQRANVLFASLPQSEAWKTYKAYSEVVLAGLEAHRDKWDHSRSLLEQSAAGIANIDDFIIQLSYYQTNGELQLKDKQFDEAEKSFHVALQICRDWLLHLRDASDRMALQTFAENIYRDLMIIEISSHSRPERALGLWQEFRALTEGKILEAPHSRKTGENGITSSDAFVHQIRALHDRSLLTLVPFPDGIGIWLGDDRGISFRKIPLNVADLEHKIHHFHRLCSRPESDEKEILNSGKELYALLIAPIAKNLDHHRVLLIDADDSLSNLPFQALMDEEGHYLGQSTAIIHSPGLSFEMELGHRNEARLLEEEASILAPTAPYNLVNDPLPLEDAIKEAQSVATHYPRHTLLLAKEATRDALLAALRYSSTFHFAGHAMFKNDRFGLLLASPSQDDKAEADIEFFSSENIKKGISPDLRLVVLAACSTASSGEDDLYSRRNLVQAFLRAGVAHVVATQWDVDSEATRALMEKFYSELASGRSVAEALRQAQVVVFSRKSSSHPYYWAAFTAAGGS